MIDEFHLSRSRIGRAVIDEDEVELVGWTGYVFGAKWSRPKEPNIEALRSLITSLPAKEPVEA